MPFVCKKCGLCCKLCDKHPELYRYDRGDGICINLQADNTCAVYETRPDICSIERNHKRGKSGISLEEYYELASDGCKKIKISFDINK